MNKKYIKYLLMLIIAMSVIVTAGAEEIVKVIDVGPIDVGDSKGKSVRWVGNCII